MNCSFQDVFTRLLFVSVLCLMSASAVAIPISRYQFIGSHNSYKKAIPPAVIQWINQHDPALAAQINYHHIPLTQQLDLGLRQLEIDVLDDPDGGRYIHPLAEQFTPSPIYNVAEQQALMLPGFKVLHIPDIDMRSDCLRFSVCLQQLKQWSQQHPHHMPVFILMNVKESKPAFIGGAQPTQFDTDAFAHLATRISDSLGNALFTPHPIARHSQ